MSEFMLYGRGRVTAGQGNNCNQLEYEAFGLESSTQPDYFLDMPGSQALSETMLYHALARCSVTNDTSDTSSQEDKQVAHSSDYPMLQQSALNTGNYSRSRSGVQPSLPARYATTGQLDVDSEAMLAALIEDAERITGTSHTAASTIAAAGTSYKPAVPLAQQLLASNRAHCKRPPTLPRSAPRTITAAGTSLSPSPAPQAQERGAEAAVQVPAAAHCTQPSSLPPAPAGPQARQPAGAAAGPAVITAAAAPAQTPDSNLGGTQKVPCLCLTHANLLPQLLLCEASTLAINLEPSLQWNTKPPAAQTAV
ncbi:hypothetical protein QJQ45_017538 [Haematococcus lacustris]|nr:hypothetical protein QJQ45_017538 [Haematococcus lacustris]